MAEAHTPTESGDQGPALGVAVKALSVVWLLEERLSVRRGSPSGERERERQKPSPVMVTANGR